MEMGARTIEIEEDIEGERTGTENLFFERIGDSFPIKADVDDSRFDTQNPPSLPLAVSQRSHRLIFVAHSSGFCVAKTKDVIDAAKQIKEKGKGYCIQELSVVDVPLEKVRILVLSTDESMLAVSLCESRDIHFFSVDSLLNKQVKPFFSTSLDDSSYVKDIRWRKKEENSFLVLSDLGKLYRGAVDGPLQHVMDNVDAVEWSTKGKFVAVAKNNILSILTSKFKERLCISLSFKSWVGDSDVNCRVKVDSIRWVRRDCIIIGCYQLTEDGKEENYLVQVIRSKDGKITSASSQPVLRSFSDVFEGLIDDILPSGTGPYLFLSYLEQCELAITANRKNTDQHVMLLGWSLGDEKDEVAVIDILRDKWVPRIELQDNGDDNLIMGLCIDKVSLYGKVKVQLGVEEQKELSPYCILMCLTLEGKLNMFHVASLSGPLVSSDAASTLSDEEEDVAAVVSIDSDLPKVSSGLGEPKEELVAPSLMSQDLKLREPKMNISGEILNKHSRKDLDKFDSSTSVSDNQKSLHKDSPQIQHSMQQSANLGQSSAKASPFEGTSYAVKDSRETGAQNIAGFGLVSDAFVRKLQIDTPSLSDHKYLSQNFQFGKESQGNFGSVGIQSSLSHSWSSGKFISSEDCSVRSPLLPSSESQAKKSENSGAGSGTANVSGSFVGKSFSLKDASGTSSSLNFSVKPVQSDSERASTGSGKIESLPSIHSAQFSSQLKFASGKSQNQKLYPLKDDHKTPPLSGLPNSEPNLSKHSGNLKEMTRELDILLKSIEEAGGFRDACTVFQKSKVEELEAGIGTLSQKCRMWRTITDDRLEEIQDLVDKTVQVLARKIYIEGIVKQASDIQYWDLWSRQKLSPELELKRRHVLNLNQDLTNQLIELERHFNSLELNKFGENDGVHADPRGPQSKFGTSRHIQSLHSLHNTMSSQLAVAEQLSARLSKQMSVLSIESPVRQQNVKKELFETIGLPYEASFSSPDAAKVTDPSSLKKLLYSPGSTSTKDLSKRRQSSAIKSYDPETVRRRRDSLDRSWASFEPPKTTVKRMLLQEHQKGTPVGSSLKDRQYSSTRILEGAAIVRRKDQTTPSTPSYPSGVKESTHDTSQKQASQNQPTLFKWANDAAGPSESTGLKSPVFKSYTAAASGLSSLSATKLPPMRWQNNARNTGSMTAEKISSGISLVEKSNSMPINETKSILRSESNIFAKSSISTMSPSSPKKTSEMPHSSKGTVPTSSPFGIERNAHLSPPAAIPSSSAFPGLVSHFDAANKDQPVGIESTPLAFSLPLSAQSSPVVGSLSALTFSTSSSTTSSATMSIGGSLSSSIATMDTKPTVSSTPTFLTSSSQIAWSSSAPSSSSTIFSSSTFFSPQALKTPVPLSTPAPSVNSIRDSPKTEPQLPKGKVDSTADVDAAMQAPPVQPTSKLETSVSSPVQPGPPASESTSKFEPSVSSASLVEIPSGSTSGSQPMTNMLTAFSKGALNAQSEPLSTTNSLFSTPLQTDNSTTGKNENLDIAVTQEDEMEEEAPETSQATELSLGVLGSFGLGSTSNPTAPKPNLFGGPFGNAATSPASSSFPTPVASGQLFRPASFNFQSPQSSQPSQPTSFNTFSGGFGPGSTAQTPTQSGFGRPAQVGPGQQALGSVLGAFGQSRQLGGGFAASPTSGFGGGFAAASPTGGFSSAATAGGFAGVGSTAGGFASLASGGGGFASLASGGGGFAAAASGGGGFGGVASAGGGFGSGGFAAAAGGGFAAFGGQGSSFGASGGVSGRPPELFTQIRK